MSKPIIGLLSGSSRTASMNRKLVTAMAHVFTAAGANVQIIDLSDYEMPIYNGDFEDANGQPETAHALIKTLMGCDGVFIATPEYNGSLPALLKNTIDWTTRIGLEHFSTPVYAIGSATPGALSGIMALRQLHFILNRLGAQVVPTQLGIGQYGQAFDENGDFKNAATMSQAEKLAQQVLSAIRHKK